MNQMGCPQEQQRPRDYIWRQLLNFWQKIAKKKTISYHEIS
jgi:hypothetical protein